MRILILGAGGIGGYFGGRLVENGEEVVFLVRQNRKKQLEENGLTIKSTHGDYIFQPNLITKDDKTEPFDVVLFSTKAYHLTEAIADLKPFVTDKTVIIPLLNGIAHLTELKRTFPADQVIGGLCLIETTLNQAGEVVHTSAFDRLVFGEFTGTKTERIQKIAHAFNGTKADFNLSEHILQDMWHKYLRITVLSGLTTLMRAPIGPIRGSVGGRDIIKSLYAEVTKIMRADQAPITDTVESEQIQSIDGLAASFKTSMQRDMEKGALIEADHLQGHLLTIAQQYGIETPYLNAIYQNLKVYEKMQLHKKTT